MPGFSRFRLNSFCKVQRNNMDVKLDFEHQQTAHCETGATANLLNFGGLKVSEPMVFGIGGGLFFGYFPFVKLNYIPLTSFRHAPGHIFKKFTSRLGIRVKTIRFKDQNTAMQTLDDLLKEGIPVAVQTGTYWLPYFPSAYRFHFNAHNIVVYGRKNGEYLVSDPNMDHPVMLKYEDMQRARFAQGSLAPKGKLYYPTEIPEKVSLGPQIIKGIREISFNMLNIPLPILGVRGIRYVARKLRRWPDQLGPEKASRYLGQLIRMQEEIGTGGAGFRFIFASFLQEAAQILDQNWLNEMSAEVTLVGDRWREFALLGSRNCKGRATEEESYDKLADILLDCAQQEERIFLQLKKITL